MKIAHEHSSRIRRVVHPKIGSETEHWDEDRGFKLAYASGRRLSPQKFLVKLDLVQSQYLDELIPERYFLVMSLLIGNVI